MAGRLRFWGECGVSFHCVLHCHAALKSRHYIKQAAVLCFCVPVLYLPDFRLTYPQQHGGVALRIVLPSFTLVCPCRWSPRGFASVLLLVISSHPRAIRATSLSSSFRAGVEVKPGADVTQSPGDDCDYIHISMVRNRCTGNASWPSSSCHKLCGQ